ncbi:MAG: histidine phosphatase family protein [bacterium]|nr:histidine phosphatase family protein [bacterium]
MNLTKTIYIVRHGSTEFNEKGIWQGQRNSPLNEKGITEVRQLSQALKSDAFDIIYHSPLKRAHQTAEIINEHQNTTLKPIDGLVEIGLGEFDGRKHEDILLHHRDVYEKWVSDNDFPVPGGESYNQVCDRVSLSLPEILDAPFNKILIVAHAIVNRAILGGFLKMDRLSSRRFRMNNAAFSRFFVYEKDTPEKHLVVDTWNSTSHLPATKPPRV